MSGGQVRLTGRLRVALPPRVAFRLFTPRGERDWAEGWEPRFPVPAPDDTVPGTVFETGAHGATTTWLVLAREPGRHISYARVTPGDRAGTVAVTLDEADGQSSVEVTYGRTPSRPGRSARDRPNAELRRVDRAAGSERFGGPRVRLSGVRLYVVS
jgi:hypothetical protein